MNVSVPVLSPIASYEATGASAWRPRRTSSNPLHRRYVGRPSPSHPRANVSHDFSSLPPTPPRRRLPAAALLLPLLACVTACTTTDAGASHFLIVKLPASVVLLIGAGVGCGLAGFGSGLIVALQLLRAANSAASQYHRAEVARVLSASSAVHAAVQEVVRAAHARIHELRRLLASMQQGGAR
jgi:F0F1-type ATP synthase membrane subunit c/vacuolar-type H+-ATPase subunit K